MTNSSVCNYRGDFSCGRCQCTEYGSHAEHKCVCIIFPYRGFGRLCECELPEGADPNNQGSGYDQCPLVKHVVMVTTLHMYVIMQSS